MANVYYQMFDRTRKPHDPNFAHFWSQPMNNDLAGVVLAFAKHNRVEPSEVRLFLYETKKAWERAMNAWLAGVDWNIPLLP
jgi:hypothetical protein